MVRLPMPGDMVRLAERGYAGVEQALGLLPRVTELVAQLERIAARAETALGGLDQTRQRADELVERTGAVLDRAEQVLTGTDELLAGAELVSKRADALVGEASQVSKRADALVGEAGQVSKRADALVGEAGQAVASTQQLTGQAGELLGGFEPTLSRLAPMLDRLASTTSPAEVDAVIQLIDTMPELVERLRKEILPILSTMTNVAPDVRELLETTKEFTEILGSVPGLGRLKKRVEEREQQHDAERAEIEAAVERP